MAKRIKMSGEAVNQIITDFGQWLRGLTTFDKASYSPKLAKVEAKATLYFTEAAFMKMQYLVAVYDTEAAWHGVAKRVEEGKSDFVVTDILVYPQEVTGATVNTDQAKYQDWLYGLDDDVFNNLRFQGHSHVRMATTPSATDLEHQRNLTSQLEGDMFYIFVIWNKDNKRTVMIHDMAQNLMFDNEDVDVKIIQDDKLGFLKLMDDAKSMITKKSYSYAGAAGYGGCGATGYGYGSTFSGAKTATGAAAGAKAATNITQSAGAKAVQSAAAKVSPATRADGVQSGYWWDDESGDWGYGYDR